MTGKIGVDVYIDTYFSIFLKKSYVEIPEGLLLRLKQYKQSGFFVMLFTPVEQERLALNPKFLMIGREDLLIEPKGYVNVFGVYPVFS